MLRIRKNVQESVTFVGELKVAFPHFAACSACSTADVLNLCLDYWNHPRSHLSLRETCPSLESLSLSSFLYRLLLLLSLCFPLLSFYILLVSVFDRGGLSFVPSSSFIKDGKVFKSMWMEDGMKDSYPCQSGI